MMATNDLLEDACAVRLLVAITFRFDVSRLPYLAEVLRGLAEFAIARLDVVVVTDCCQAEGLATLRRLGHEVMVARGFDIRSHTDLADPWDLTWCHKTLITDLFVGGSRYTHFLYLEDDIRFSFANLVYWLDYRRRLRGAGLLPAFVRVEYNSAAAGFAASDAFWPIYPPAQSYRRLGEILMVNLPNPYNPLYLMDAELGREYVATRSFDRQASASVVQWGISERAAMGLCHENVPPPFQNRYLVPVSVNSNQVPAAAWVTHLPRNYAENPASMLGKLRIDSLFSGAGAVVETTGWDTRHAATARSFPAVLPAFQPRGAACRQTAPNSLYYLVSDHDTVVYFDHATAQLRQAPFGIAPFNLVLELLDQSARLLTAHEQQDAYWQASFTANASALRLQPGLGDPDCAIEYFLDWTIAIFAHGHYVSAQLDGYVRNDHAVCHQWERFRLIRADTLQAMALMHRYHWVCQADRRIVTLVDQPIYVERDVQSEVSALAATLSPGAIDHRRLLRFGPAQFPLTGFHASITLHWSDDGDNQVAPIEIEACDAAGATQRFRRFTPLVHYDVSGDDAQYAALHRSLISLAEQGRYRGTIRVACDRARAELLAHIPAVFQDDLLVSPAGLTDVSDDGLYRPILVCRPDAVFTTDIADALIDLLLQGQAESVYTNAPDEPGGDASDELDLAGLGRMIPRHGCVVVIGSVSSETTQRLISHIRADATVYCLGATTVDDPITSRAEIGPTVIALAGASPHDFVGWRRELDLCVVAEHCSPNALHMHLSFWSRLLRPVAALCGILDPAAPDALRIELENSAATSGARLSVTEDLWCIRLPGA